MPTNLPLKIKARSVIFGCFEVERFVFDPSIALISLFAVAGLFRL